MSDYAHRRTRGVDDPADESWSADPVAGTTARRATMWTGWIVFAGIVMIMIGSFNAIEGLVALINPNYYVVGPDNVLVFDLTAWGWVQLIGGAVVLITGIALLGGSTWARPVTVILAAIDAIVQLTFVGVYPVWSVISITLCVVVIWAIVVHGNESRLDW